MQNQLDKNPIKKENHAVTLDLTLGLFEDKTFQNEDLSYDEINEKRFNECTFIQCNFTEATLYKCRFIECTFRDCNLTVTKLKSCTFSNTSFDNSVLRGVDWVAIQCPRIRLHCPVKFTNCLLDYGSFFGLNLEKIQIHQCKARHVDFREADLTGADLTETDFTDSEFVKTNLTKADFRNAKNYRIDITLNRTKQAQFSLPEALSLLNALDIKIT